MRSRICVCALLLLVVMLSGCMGEVTLEPATPVTMPSAVEETQPPTMTATAPGTTAPGTTVIDAEALFVEKCSVCHTSTRATSKQKTREQWESTVERMVTVRGGRARAGITDEDAAMIVDYLTENYSLS